MPAGSRIRANNVLGTITDNPLTIGSTTFNSALLPLLPSVVGNHAIVTLDPLRQYGEPEIVIVTVHTAASTSATIQRGAYGTTARSHPFETVWIHNPMNEDYISIVTSDTRPSDPYEGQPIYETDTNKLVMYGGVDWAPRDAGGQIGYAQVTTPDQVVGAETDLTGLSVAVTVGTGRRVKITGFSHLFNDVNAGLSLGLIKEGATVLGRWVSNQMIASGFAIGTASVVITPSAGVHTYKLSLQKFSGGGVVTADYDALFPGYILVEDIGAS